jgi:hypothetical protein
VLIGCACFVSFHPASAEQRRPNIVLIMADDK